jgi:hypothetical protein
LAWVRNHTALRYFGQVQDAYARHYDAHLFITLEAGSKSDLIAFIR